MALALQIGNRQSPIGNSVEWIPLADAAALLGVSERTARWHCRRWQRTGLAELRPAAAVGRALPAEQNPAVPGPQSAIPSETGRGPGRPTWFVSRAAHPLLDRVVTDDVREERDRESLLARYPAHHVDLAFRRAFWLRQWRQPCGTGFQPVNQNVGQVLAPAIRPRATALRAVRASQISDLKSRAAAIVAAAREREGPAFAISYRSLQNWHRAYTKIVPAKPGCARGRIAGVEALIPRYASPAPSPIANCQLPMANPPSRSPEAVDYFYSLYHSQARHSARAAHDATLHAARQEGWSWPESYAATTRWLREYDQRDVTCLHREGSGAYAHRHLPHVEIDWSTIEPGDWYVCDHTQVDYWVAQEAARQPGNQATRRCGTGLEPVGPQSAIRNPQLIRPWLTTVLDCRSRVVVGWALGESPNQDQILQAFRMAFADWAVPTRLRIDNGEDWCSELICGVTKKERDRLRRELGPEWKEALVHNDEVLWTGVCLELGIELIYARAYAPWSKGLKERWYRSYEDHCAKQFPTYCGNSPANRPEVSEIMKQGATRQQGNKATRRQRDSGAAAAPPFAIPDSPFAIPTLAEARELTAQHIALYHARAHTGDGMDGAAPLEVWRTATRLRRAVDEQLLTLMQTRGVYRVGGNGVRFRLGGKSFGYGADSVALRAHVGRDVLITMDPADASCCFAWTPQRERRAYIGRLSANKRIPANASIEEVRAAIRSVEKRRKVMRQAEAEASARMRDAAAEVRHFRRAQYEALQATGTCDTGFQPVIAPVRTGFERRSMPPRSAACGTGFQPVDPVGRALPAAFDGEPDTDLSCFLSDEPEEHDDDAPFDDDAVWLDDESDAATEGDADDILDDLP